MSQIAPVIAKVSFRSQLNKQQRWYHLSRSRRCLNVGTTDPNFYLSKEQYRLFRTGEGRCCLAETLWFPKLYSGSSLSFQLGGRRQFSELSSSSLPSSLSPPTTETISQTTRTRINFNHSENIPSELSIPSLQHRVSIDCPTLSARTSLDNSRYAALLKILYVIGPTKPF